MVNNSEDSERRDVLNNIESNEKDVHKRVVKISPSTLNLSLEEMATKLKEIENVIDYIHIDVMDGKFVPNKTEGVLMFQAGKENSKKLLDVHLMVENPLEEVSKYEGADIITFHIEATKDNEELMKIINKIKSLGAKVGISIKPATSVEFLKDILQDVDMILVMTVEPGFGGQKLLLDTLKKVEQLRELGFKKLIEVDGGIKIENAALVRAAGVDIIVAGTAVFSAENPIEAVQKIKGLK